ncbi:hypothetical protein SAMN05518849_11676 [Sphingobium sp. AP50]|uniref:hypothetical protein n=1 Tax=Sphingobium sp. AP50 TaxID=1884369 RepID=UPI0008C8771E|nr:hypothetical protein [Sphingobium sp. AP50]SEJ87402.1 hypothetical protein SAMN05518849_11676 [Sphingobium sp. AP50]
MAIDEIVELVRDRGSKLNQYDLNQIKMIAVDVPLEDSEDLAMVFEGIALVVNDPLYEGDIPPME